MAIKPVRLGTLSFRIETSQPVDPNSALAQELARDLAQSVNAALAAKIPTYAIRAKVAEVRAGSIIALLELYAHIGAAGGVAIALSKFAKDYPSIRAGVLQLARDIKAVATALGSIGPMPAVRVERESLLTKEQIDIAAKRAIRQNQNMPGPPTPA